MSAIGTIYRGDTFQGTVYLKVLTDNCNPCITIPYDIPSGSTIEMNWPGATSTVVLSTANVGEITGINNTLGFFSFKGSPVKSALLKLGAKQAVDIIVTDTGGNILTFEKAQIVTIKDRANP